MKLNIQFSVLLFGLIILILAKDNGNKITKIKITTTHEDETSEEEDKEKEKKEETAKNTNETNKEKSEKEKISQDNKRDNAESNVEKMIKEARKYAKETTTEKVLTLIVPYQDNEDYIVSPMGFGTPVNFVPLQVETTSYKTWIISLLNEANPSVFSYNLKESSTAEEVGDWDTVVDEEGTISGNVIYDLAYIGKYKIPKFKFIEAVEFEDEFKDFKTGKLGLGNCHYASSGDKEFCLIQRLKDNGSIDKRIFSLREVSDTHGEIIIGDVPPAVKEKDYPLLNVINEDAYNDIEDDEFKMGWITKISHVIFRRGADDIKQIFNNNIYLKDGLVSFDSSCHYIEAPYKYINYFEEQMFDVYYENACRKVNRDGTYMFLCNKERYEAIKDNNKDLAFILVIGGYGFEIPMNFLFEQTSVDDYEFFVHFKDYEANIWNLGHPFFHYYTIMFDQDNQEIGIDGEMIYSLQDETEEALKKKETGSWWKVIFWILFGLLLLVGLFLLGRKLANDYKIGRGVDPNLVDNESADDLSFVPGTNVHNP